MALGRKIQYNSNQKAFRSMDERDKGRCAMSTKIYKPVKFKFINEAPSIMKFF